MPAPPTVIISNTETMERCQSHNPDCTSHSERPDGNAQPNGVSGTGAPPDERNIGPTAVDLDLQRVVRRNWDALDPTIRWVADRVGVLGQILGPDGATADPSSPQLIGRHWRTLVPADDHPLVALALRQCLADGHLLDVRCRFVFGAGEALWYRTRAIACRDASGRVTGWHGRSENIHQQVLAENALRGSEEHYRYTVQLNPGIPWTATPDGFIEEASPRWMEATGQTEESLKGTGWVDALYRDDVAPTVAAWQAALRSGNPVDIEYRINGRDGGHRWVRARAQPRRNGRGEIVRWYGTLEDIDDRKAAENALRENEQRFRLAVRAAALGVWDFDPQTGCEIWSDELKAIFGVPADTSPQAGTACRLMDPADKDRLESALAAPADGSLQQEFDITLRIRRADDGQERWLSARGWKTFLPSGPLGRALVTFRDITDERTAAERIRWMATHDALTGLPNRLAFQQEVERLITLDLHGRDAGLAILIADVDDLKGTNDQIGHDAGDALLCALAQRLREVLPAQAFIARLGGDEFGVALPSVSRADIHDVGMAVGARLRQPLSYAQRVLDCRASIGVACFPEHGADATDLLKATDTALYAAKTSARGGMTVFHPDMRRKARDRAEMIACARRAIDADRIRPFYQPKVDLQTGRVTGFEALLRWHTGDGRMLPPAGIAAAFENVELAVKLHERMFSNILADVHRWLDAGLPFGRIAINAAAAQFMHDDFSDAFLSRLAAERVAPERFEIEVTETVFLGRSAEGVGRALRRLSDEGVRIALDDFGTGYASLTHLQAFPVHTIKIDRSFVADLDTQAGNVAIVEAVVALSHKLGMDTVAEGVEQASQCDFLRRCGCDTVQGFLFSPAIDPQHVPALLLQSWGA